MMAKFGNGTYKRNIEPELEKLKIAFVFERTVDNNFIIGSSRALWVMTRVSPLKLCAAWPNVPYGFTLS